MTEMPSRSSDETSCAAVCGRRSDLRHVLSFLGRTMASLCWMLVTAGVVLRLTVQDRYHPWAMIYYLTPLAAIPLWLLLAGLVAGPSLHRRGSNSDLSLARLYPLAIMIFAAWACQAEYLKRAEPLAPDDIKVVFWNTARLPFGITGPARQISEHTPTLIGLVESSDYQPEFVERWQKELPDYEIAGTHFGGLVAVKGHVTRQISYDLLPNSVCEQFDLIINDRPITLLLVDISSQLNLSRQNPLQELADLCDRLSDRPLIVMGDFNTPDDSVLFDPLRVHCRNAARHRGAGYAPSWPVPLPVLTLDQVWVNPQVQVRRCEYGWSRYSDHRPAITHMSFGETH